MYIKLYKKEDGTEPVTEFLQGLDMAMHAKAMHTIDLLKEHGHMLRPPYAKKLDDESWSYASMQETTSRGFSTSS